MRPSLSVTSVAVLVDMNPQSREEEDLREVGAEGGGVELLIMMTQVFPRRRR